MSPDMGPGSYSTHRTIRIQFLANPVLGDAVVLGWGEKPEPHVVLDLAFLNVVSETAKASEFLAEVDLAQCGESSAGD